MSTTATSPYTHADVQGDPTNTITEKERQHYGQLIGATIQRVVLVKPEGEAIDWFEDEYTPVLILTTKDGRELQVELWSDGEGNGAGYADIIDVTHPDTQHS
jgi:hypothetical protein